MLGAKMTQTKILGPFLAAFFGLVTGLVACAGDRQTAPLEARLQTKVFGVAALNTSGAQVEARSFSDGAIIGSPTSTDERGHYQLGLKSFSGDLVVRVCGGSYTDMVTGIRTEVGEDCLHALAVDVAVCEERQVNVSPFSEFTHSYSRARGLEGAKALEAHMKGWTGEMDATTRASVFADPGDTERRAGLEFSPRSMSYLMLGGFSGLARDLSEKAGLQPGLRLSTMRLAKLISEDISDGTIDGGKGDTRLMISESHPLPPRLLRQDFAQAIRNFADSGRNQSSLTSESVLDALSSISLDRLPALGPEGEQLDREAPAIFIMGVSDSAVVTADTAVRCLARDASGVREVSMEMRAYQSDEALQQQETLAEGGHQTERSLSLLLEVGGRSSGQYTVVCRAADVWGNAQEQQVVFHVNRGMVAPEIALDPPLLNTADTVAGARTVRCTFDDPYVTAIRAHIEGPTGRIDIPVVNGISSLSYDWDSAGDMDGIHTLSCQAWTSGHQNPRVLTTTVRVKNHAQGLAVGKVFLGVPVNRMQVSAYSWGSGVDSLSLGDTVSASEEDGSFELPISNEYQGPILLKATIDPESAHPSMQSMLYSEHHQELPRDFSLTLLVESYQPGIRMEPLAINAATTLAVELADGNLERRPDRGAAFHIRSALNTVGQVVFPGGFLDLSTTNVPSMTNPIRGIRDEGVALGLFHAGLAKMAADECQQNRQSRDASTLVDLLSCLRNDIRSGELNGRDSEGRQSRTRFANGSPNMLRCQLAKAVHSWLQASDDAALQTNNTGLTQDIVLSSGWLQRVSAHGHTIFGGAPATPFDLEGPTIRVECRSFSGDIVECDSLFRDQVVLRVAAHDDVGVERTEAFYRGHRLQGEAGGTPEEMVYRVRAEDNYFGEDIVTIRSWDRMHNVSEILIPVAFDQRPIELEGALPEYRIHQSGPFLVSLHASRNVVKITVSGEELARNGLDIEEQVSELEGALDITASLTIPDRDGLYRFRVVVEDAVGNTGQVFLSVVLNSQPMQLECSGITMEQRDRPVHMTANNAFGDIRELSFYDIDLDPYRWSCDTPPRWPQWTAWATRDGHTVGSEPRDPVRAWYKYSLSDGGVRTQGSWRELTSDEENAAIFPIEMNYLTMLSSLHDVPTVQLSAEENIVFYSSPDAQHCFELRIEDAFGVVVQAEWRYRLNLHPPPVDVWIRRQGPPENVSWREFTRTVLEQGHVSDVVAEVTWLDSMCQDDDARRFGISMLPEFIPVRIRMDDLTQVWRVSTVYGTNTPLYQILNFYGSSEWLDVSRGTSSTPLVTTETRHPVSPRPRFFEELEKPESSVSREFYMVGAAQSWQGQAPGNTYWTWHIELDGDMTNEKTPRLRADPRPFRHPNTRCHGIGCFGPVDPSIRVENDFWDGISETLSD